MPQRIFAPKQRRANWPLRIALCVLLCAIGYGGYRYLAPVATPFINEVLPTSVTTETAPPVAEEVPSTPGQNSITQARTSFQSGDLAGARALLEPILQGTSDAELLPEALILAGELEEKAGNAPQAIALLERVQKEFPSNPDIPRASGIYARALEQAGRDAEADQIFAHLRETAPKGMRAAGLMALARKSEQQGALANARDQYRDALNDAEIGTAAWEEALDNLGRLNVQLIFSPGETPEARYYEVEKGDNLTGIGIKLNTTQGLLTRANNITDDSRLNLGQRLKYTPKDFRILIERATCTLYLFDNDGIFKRYRTGLGMPGHETTLGSYTIGNKQKDPVWHPQGRPPVASGAPDNELGTRWMPLVPVAPNLPNDLGIHGTIAPETIGLYKSHGCPRMLKEDVEELYDLVVRSTPVLIVEMIDWKAPFDAPAPAADTLATSKEPEAAPGGDDKPLTP